MPDSPFSQSVRPVWAAAIGLPSTTMIRKPMISVDSSGMTTTGMMPRTPLGTFSRVDPA